MKYLALLLSVLPFFALVAYFDIWAALLGVFMWQGGVLMEGNHLRSQSK